MNFHKYFLFFLFKSFSILTNKTKNTQLSDLLFGKSPLCILTKRNNRRVVKKK